MYLIMNMKCAILLLLPSLITAVVLYCDNLVDVKPITEKTSDIIFSYQLEQRSSGWILKFEFHKPIRNLHVKIPMSAVSTQVSEDTWEVILSPSNIFGKGDIIYVVMTTVFETPSTVLSVTLNGDRLCSDGMSKLAGFSDLMEMQSVSNLLDNNNCGLRPFYKRSGYAQKAGDGEFPWIASIWDAKIDDPVKHVCTGTIISPKLILTAAQCLTIQRSSRAKHPADLNVYVGISSLDNVKDSEIHQKKVSEIHIWPEYNYLRLTGNVAVLKLAEEINMNNQTVRICLRKRSHFTAILGQVSGWIRSKDGNLINDLGKASLKVFTRRRCNFLPLQRKLDSRNLCGGYSKSTSQCFGGDLGSPVVYEETEHEYGKRFFLKGILGAPNLEVVCDPKQVIVIEDIDSYWEWIVKHLSSS